MIFYNRHPTITFAVTYHICYNMKGKCCIGYLLPNFINVTYLPDSIRERNNRILCIYIHSLQDITNFFSFHIYIVF